MRIDGLVHTSKVLLCVYKEWYTKEDVKKTFVDTSDYIADEVLEQLSSEFSECSDVVITVEIYK